MNTTNDGTKGGELEGPAHSECDDTGCGIDAAVVDAGGKEVELEGDEIILNEKSMRDRRTFVIKGTPMQIASAINSMDGNGIVIKAGATVTDLESGKIRRLRGKAGPKVSEENGKPIKLEENQVIINKRSLRDTREFVVKGTMREIASAINSMDGNGVEIDNGATMKNLQTGQVQVMKAGGNVGGKPKKGRKAPTISATKFPAGLRRVSDNDGELYDVVKIKNGTRRWAKAPSLIATKETIDFLKKGIEGDLQIPKGGVEINVMNDSVNTISRLLNFLVGDLNRSIALGGVSAYDIRDVKRISVQPKTSGVMSTVILKDTLAGVNSTQNIDWFIDTYVKTAPSSGSPSTPVLKPVISANDVLGGMIWRMESGVRFEPQLSAKTGKYQWAKFKKLGNPWVQVILKTAEMYDPVSARRFLVDIKQKRRIGKSEAIQVLLENNFTLTPSAKSENIKDIATLEVVPSDVEGGIIQTWEETPDYLLSRAKSSVPREIITFEELVKEYSVQTGTNTTSKTTTATTTATTKSSTLPPSGPRVSVQLSYKDVARRLKHFFSEAKGTWRLNTERNSRALDIAMMVIDEMGIKEHPTSKGRSSDTSNVIIDFDVTNVAGSPLGFSYFYDSGVEAAKFPKKFKELTFKDFGLFHPLDDIENWDGVLLEPEILKGTSVASKSKPAKAKSEESVDDSPAEKMEIELPEKGSASEDIDDIQVLLEHSAIIRDSQMRRELFEELKGAQDELLEEGVFEATRQGLHDFSSNSINKEKALMSPSGLLEYYFTQATQSPVIRLGKPSELPTVGGKKSKLPATVYKEIRTAAFMRFFGNWFEAFSDNDYSDCSIMIDKETKEPKVFYHAVRKYNKKSRMANMGQGIKRPYGAFEPPNFPMSYFGESRDYVDFYAGMAKNQPKPEESYEGFIYPVFLNVRNPVRLDELGFKATYQQVIDYLLVKYGVVVEPSQYILDNIGLDREQKIWVYVRNDIRMLEAIRAQGYDAIFQIGDVPKYNKKGVVSGSIEGNEYLVFDPNQIKSVTVKKSLYLDFFNDIRFKDGGII